MQRRLDLNEPSSKMLAAISVFLLVIPLALAMALLLLESYGVSEPAIPLLIKLSLVLGVLLSLAFGILAVAEQILDRRYHHDYCRQMDRKLDSGDGRYECQYCGNRQVSLSDHYCRICGKHLR